MKAKEYAALYKKHIDAGAGNVTAAGVVVQEMVREIKKLSDARGSKSGTTLFAILKELDQKWRAFVRRIADPEIALDGFARVIRAEYPELTIHLDMRDALKVEDRA